MEIELPDGTVLEAPDGADVRKVVEGYKRQQGLAKLKQSNPAEYDPESEEYKARYGPTEYTQSIRSRGNNPQDPVTGKPLPMPMIPKYEGAAGLGSGAVRGATGLLNLALPDSLTPSFASDKALQNADERDKDLPLAPKILGGLAATAPLSAGTGALLSGASRAAGAGSALARTLASPITRGAVEGAEQGAIYADPEEQGTGALTGAALGGGLSAVASAGGRMLRGLVNKSQEAKDLEQLAAQHGEEIFVPVSQAAGDTDISSRLVKTLYKEGLPIVPGVRGRLERQAAEGADKLRELAVQEAVPTGGILPPNAGNKPLSAVQNLRHQFDKEYADTVKAYAFNVPKNPAHDVAAAVAASAPKNSVVNATTVAKVSQDVADLIKKFSSGGKAIDGANLLNVKEGISKLMKTAPSRADKAAYRAADEYIDNIIINELKQGGSPQNLADLQKYLELTPAWRALTPLAKAAEAAAPQEGRFLFSDLARRATRSPEQRTLGQLGAATFDKPVASTSRAGQLLATAAVPAAAVGAKLAPVTTGLIVGGGHLLSSKSAQKALMGDLRLQRFLAKLLRDNPQMKAALGSAGRNAVIQQTERP